MIHHTESKVIATNSLILHAAWGIDSRFAVFDIETTGLQSGHHVVYAISLLLFSTIDTSQPTLHYLQTEALDEEAELLQTAASQLSDYPIWLSYNGTAFDLPFLQNRCRILALSKLFQPQRHIDLFRLLLPYRRTLFPNGMRQVQLEELLGLQRTEFISGEDVIAHYFIYLQTKSRDSFTHLYRHNTDDVCGLAGLLVLGQILLWQQPAYWQSITVETTTDQLRLTAESAYPIPKGLIPLVLKSQPGSDETISQTLKLSCEGNRFCLDIPITRAELRYFFEDYQNYDYLPDEDIAIHRSLSAFVERGHKKRATRGTAYAKKTGCFIPLPSTISITEVKQPVFYHSYRSQPALIEFDTLPSKEWGKLMAGYLAYLLPGK